MTIKELKEQLNRFDDDCEVVWTGDYETAGYNSFCKNHKIKSIFEIASEWPDYKTRHDGTKFESNFPKEYFLKFIGKELEWDSKTGSNHSIEIFEKYKDKAKKVVVLL